MNVTTYVNQSISQASPEETAIALKRKIIDKYLELISCLNVGKPYNYLIILEMISLLDISEVLDIKYINYYLSKLNG